MPLKVLISVWNTQMILIINEKKKKKKKYIILILLKFKIYQPLALISFTFNIVVRHLFNNVNTKYSPSSAHILPGRRKPNWNWDQGGTKIFTGGGVKQGPLNKIIWYPKIRHCCLQKPHQELAPVPFSRYIPLPIFQIFYLYEIKFAPF